MPGRVLPELALLYGHDKLVKAKFGTWNLIDISLREPVRIDSWVCIDWGVERKMDPGVCACAMARPCFAMPRLARLGSGSTLCVVCCKDGGKTVSVVLVVFFHSVPSTIPTCILLWLKPIAPAFATQDIPGWLSEFARTLASTGIANRGPPQVHIAVSLSFLSGQ